MLLGAGLAQSAEFSFLMARIGLAQGALTQAAFNLLLTATVVTIMLSPLVSSAAPALLRRARSPGSAADDGAAPPAGLTGHAVVCGYGRVGSIVCALLERHGRPFVVVEEDPRVVEPLRARGVAVVMGDAGVPAVLDRANLRAASLVVLCVPERMAARRALEYAREQSQTVAVLARTHSDEDRRFLQARGAQEAVVGELELALELGRAALERFDLPGDVIERSVEEARRRADP